MAVKRNIQPTSAARSVADPAELTELRKSPSLWSRAWRSFRANGPALVALVITVLLVLLAICAPLVSRYITHFTPTDQRLLDQFAPPNAKHWLGADELGRDVLMRILYGGQVSLGVAGMAVVVALVVGTLVGALAAYYGGWVDNVLMRFVDMMLSIPAIFLLILIGTLFRVSPVVLALIIALLGWFGLARLVRSEILSIKQREYVDAARVVGTSDWAIVTRHILPNVLHIIIIWATVAVPNFILTEAAISFLGLGIQPPTPSWGNMLTNSTQYFYKSITLVFIPGFFVTITVLSLSIIGNALRDALDPRLGE
jgi:peptide/nickel transport system permease protein